MPTILSRAGPLPTTHVVDGEVIQQSCVSIARLDHHLVVERGYIRVAHGPKENRFRPAIDALFRSAAYAYGPRVIGVVLSGQFDDGTAGWIRQKLQEVVYRAGMVRQAAAKHEQAQRW